MSILVTGGAGFIGSHTCVELLNQGYDIVVVDNFCNSDSSTIHRIKQITGKSFKTYDIDLLNKALLFEVFTENNINAVIHFAGLKAVGESVQMPFSYYRTNILSTLNLCEIMQECNVKKIVFSSSATVYGMSEQVPFHENLPTAPTNPYGRTKLIIEQILNDLFISDPSWGISILRYFNPIGAHESGLIGEAPNGIPNNLLPYIAKVAGGKLEQLNVYGDDYPTPDGTGVRDYIHVVDLALGHIRALEKINVDSGVHTYNLGTGSGTSVLEMVKAFEKASGKQIPYRIVDRRPGDVAVSYADTTKARKELEWIAERDIDDMCRSAWAWEQNRS